MIDFNQDLKLLPLKFKKVGFGLLLLTLLFVILAFSKAFILEKEVALNIFYSGAIVSMLILALTKSKTEDELTSRLRLKSLVSTFIFGAAFSIISPLTNLFIDGNYLQDGEALELVMKMLIFYHIIFNLLLYKR